MNVRAVLLPQWFLGISDVCALSCARDSRREQRRCGGYAVRKLLRMGGEAALQQEQLPSILTLWLPVDRLRYRKSMDRPPAPQRPSQSAAATNISEMADLCAFVCGLVGQLARCPMSALRLARKRPAHVGNVILFRGCNCGSYDRAGTVVYRQLPSCPRYCAF